MNVYKQAENELCEKLMEIISDRFFACTKPEIKQALDMHYNSKTLAEIKGKRLQNISAFELMSLCLNLGVVCPVIGYEVAIIDYAVNLKYDKERVQKLVR